MDKISSFRFYHNGIFSSDISDIPVPLLDSAEYSHYMGAEVYVTAFGERKLINFFKGFIYSV